MGGVQQAAGRGSAVTSYNSQGINVMDITYSTNDNTLKNRVRAFLRTVAERESLFGLTTQSISDLQTSFDHFVEASDLVEDPNTNSRAAYADKRSKKERLVNGYRTVVAVAQAWPEQTDEKRPELGITIRDRKPTRRPIPTELATIEVISLLRRQVTVQVRNPEGGRGKVAGAAAVQVFTHVGDTAPAAGTDWTFAMSTGKTRFDVLFPDIVPAGASVWIAVAYHNAAGTGPMSKAIQVNLPGGQAVYAREAA